MSPESGDRTLFGSLVISDPKKTRRSRAVPYSLIGHALVIGLLVLIPILWPAPLPETRDAIRALLYNPPPPPPPPLPKGSELVTKSEVVRPKTTQTDRLTVPDEHPKEVQPKPETKVAEGEQAGSETGSDLGVPEGMEEGVEGGEVGGVSGGVIGGVVGGTGDVVGDYDQPPRLINQARPVYPSDAFMNKIEGTVEVGFIIDVDGRVRRTWIVKSVPELDGAAVQAVQRWVFTPAMKSGRPVATQHISPVQFRIY